MVSAKEPTVFGGYTQAELDRAYDQRAWAPNAEAIIADLGPRSTAARASLPNARVLAYGEGADEVLDVFLPAVPRGPVPVHIHLHGGAWRSLSRHEASFIATPLIAAGVAVVIPDFTNLPQVRMPVMVDQLRRAVAFVYRSADGLGGRADAITVSGHSSGAHLAAVLAMTDWRPLGLPPDIVKGLCCVSGSYDLEAVLLSARRNYIDLTLEEAEQLSPRRHAARIACPTVLAVGSRESPEFRRQWEDFAAALPHARTLLIEEINHFEILDEMIRPGSALSLALVAVARLEAGRT